MAEQLKKAGDIQPGDIIFECPQCGKSLAIDPLGAGYLVTCPDCSSQVQVPASEASEGDNVAELENALLQSQTRLEKISKEIVLIQAALDRITTLMQ